MSLLPLGTNHYMCFACCRSIAIFLIGLLDCACFEASVTTLIFVNMLFCTVLCFGLGFYSGSGGLGYFLGICLFDVVSFSGAMDLALVWVTLLGWVGFGPKDEWVKII